MKEKILGKSEVNFSYANIEDFDKAVVTTLGNTYSEIENFSSQYYTGDSIYIGIWKYKVCYNEIEKNGFLLSWVLHENIL